MPSVRIERLPVQTLGLGVLGFDHLQLVYVTGEEGAAPEDGWFVIEGLREVSPRGITLGVEGLHGGTTLAEANGGATGADLEAKIGTANDRGSREIASGPDASRLWATLVSQASDIEAQGFPYVAYALPTSPLPTLNSSSLVASLLHHAGHDIVQSTPYGLRFSPGTETLLGTTGNDVLSPVNGFTTLLAGDGADWLTGSFDESRIDKLYGGRGDDHFQWSTGLNIIHGGQPELSYADDGRDTVDYAGVGHVTIQAGSSPLPHQSPDYIASFDRGEDRLFSIEEIVWDGASDRVLLGEGVGLIEMPITLTPGGEERGSRGDILDLSGARHGALVDERQDETTCIATEPHSCAYRIAGVEWIIGSPEADLIHAGQLARGLEGGAGDDLLDARQGNAALIPGPRGFDMEIAGGAGRDVIISGPGRIAAEGGPGSDLFVLGPETTELVIEDPEPHDRLIIEGSFDARFEREGPAANDLSMHVNRDGGEQGGDAHIRVLAFRDGDLGLSNDGADRPLVFADDRTNSNDFSQYETASAAGLPWWLIEFHDPQRALDPDAVTSSFRAPPVALVYDSDPQYCDGFAADDPDPCPW